MDRRTFSGLEIVTVLVNTGGFEWRRTTGDHAQPYYEHPTTETDHRQVTVPLHDELRIGTLRDIAESAGANDFDAFCEWIDRNARETRPSGIVVSVSSSERISGRVLYRGRESVGGGSVLRRGELDTCF